MKKSIVQLIVFLFFSFNLTAQKNIYLGNVIAADSSEFLEINRWGNLPSIVYSQNPIEIRFFSHSISRRCLVTISYEINYGWKAFWKIDHKKQIDSGFVSETVFLDSLFSVLTNHNVFALPDHNSVELGHVYYNPDDNTFFGEGTDVVCGTLCTIEFKVGGTYRSYSFSNPEEYAKFYTTHYFFKDYVAIKQAFELFLPAD